MVCVWSKKPVKIYIDKMRKISKYKSKLVENKHKDFTIRHMNPNAITRDTINLMIKWSLKTYDDDAEDHWNDDDDGHYWYWPVNMLPRFS